MGRYDRIPNPKCRHVAWGTVSAGNTSEGAFASTVVCDREACIADAQEWAEAKTGLEPNAFLPFPGKKR